MLTLQVAYIIDHYLTDCQLTNMQYSCNTFLNKGIHRFDLMSTLRRHLFVESLSLLQISVFV